VTDLADRLERVNADLAQRSGNDPEQDYRDAKGALDDAIAEIRRLEPEREGFKALATKAVAEREALRRVVEQMREALVNYMDAFERMVVPGATQAKAALAAADEVLNHAEDAATS
jgi:hypothetical protein